MMNAVAKVKKILQTNQLSHEILEHNPAYTALETAGAQHVPGRKLIKSIIVIADQQPIMCVLPAIHNICFETLKSFLNVKTLELAAEKQIVGLFPDYEVGAMPPFGQLLGMVVYVDKILEENEEIVFNAGTHTDLIRMKFKDYLHFVKPVIVDLGTHIS